MAGTLAAGGQEERVETTLTFVCTLEASRGLNKEQRVLGMRLRDCHRHMAPVFLWRWKQCSDI